MGLRLSEEEETLGGPLGANPVVLPPPHPSEVRSGVVWESAVPAGHGLLLLCQGPYLKKHRCS